MGRKLNLLLSGFPTFIHEVTEESWAFAVPGNQVRAGLLVLSGFTFTVVAWSPRGCHRQVPIDCLWVTVLLTSDLSGALCPHTVH